MGSSFEIDHPVVLFDGVCNLCNSTVHFIMDRDSGLYRFASLQSTIAQQLLELTTINPQNLEGVVLIEPNGQIFQKSDAAIRIAVRLKGLWPALRFFTVLPKGLRDCVYDAIARNRYRWFGRTDQCRITFPALQDRFLHS